MTRPLAVALWTSAALIPGGFYFALHGMYAELIIVTTIALGFIACALMAAPADQIGDERENHRPRLSPRPARTHLPQ